MRELYDLGNTVYVNKNVRFRWNLSKVLRYTSTLDVDSNDAEDIDRMVVVAHPISDANIVSEHTGDQYDYNINSLVTLRTPRTELPRWFWVAHVLRRNAHLQVNPTTLHVHWYD